jgi:hypothetical protein
MKIIAIHADGSLAGDQAHASAGSAATGWGYIGSFNSPADLIPAIQAMLDANNFDVLESLELVAHGNPTGIDNILEATAPVFGAQLKNLRLSDVCDVYLSGCNTAINLRNRDSVAQIVSANGPTVHADNVMLTVYGSVGYIAGLHMDGTENTVGNRGGAGSQTKPPIHLVGFPDAPDSRGGTAVNIGSYTAIGNACWRGYREGRRVI